MKHNCIVISTEKESILANNLKHWTFSKFIAYLMQSCIPGIKFLMPWPSKSSMNERGRGTHFLVLFQIKITLISEKKNHVENVRDADAIHCVPGLC